jgi:hypothetical protein
MLKQQIRDLRLTSLEEEDVNASAAVIWSSQRAMRCPSGTILWHVRAVHADALARALSSDSVGAISTAELAATKQALPLYDSKRTVDDIRDPVMYVVITILGPPVPMSNPSVDAATKALSGFGSTASAMDAASLTAVFADITSEHYPGDHRVAGNALLPTLPLMRDDGNGLFAAVPWQIVLRSKALLELRLSDLEASLRSRRGRGHEDEEAEDLDDRPRYGILDTLLARDHPSCRKKRRRRGSNNNDDVK